MPGEFFFMAFGGLGVSLAGFAGVIAALAPPRAADAALAAWRLRNIVIGGLRLAITGFATVALYTATGENLDLTVRLASLLLAVPFLFFFWSETRPGPEWPTESYRHFAMTVFALLFVATLVNVVLGLLGYLQILFVVYLFDSMSIFFNAVQDVSRRHAEPGDTSDSVRSPES